MQPTTQIPQEENVTQPLNNIPIAQTVAVPTKPKRKWRNLFIPTAVVFLGLMAFSVYIAHLNNQPFAGTFLIGSIVLALGISACFFLIALMLSVLGRKFGIVYPIIIWTLIVIAGVSSVYYSVYKGGINNSMPKEESVVLPPGTDLSQFPSYIEIDKSRIVQIQGGGMVIPRSAIKFIMKYDECLITKDSTAQRACATKYSLEKKDVSLCRSLINSTDPNAGESTSDFQEECIAQYAIVNKQAPLCDTIKNKFIASSCFGGLVDKITDANQCKVIFQKDPDVKDCVEGVARNLEPKNNTK